jgi:hypothetical protein
VRARVYSATAVLSEVCHVGTELHRHTHYKQPNIRRIRVVESCDRVRSRMHQVAVQLAAAACAACCALFCVLNYVVSSSAATGSSFSRAQRATRVC